MDGLSPLRESGVLILTSGSIVHNLSAIDWHLGDSGYDWAERFDNDARDLLLSTPGGMLSLQGHADFRSAAPTPDHFIPWIYFAGLATGAEGTPETLAEGYAYGSMSMTAYTLVDIGVANQGQHRTKDLFPRHHRGVIHIGQHRRLDKPPLLHPRGPTYPP